MTGSIAQHVLNLVNRWRPVFRFTQLSTGILYGRLQRVTIPDAVIIKFVLLKMSIVLLEICRGL